MVAVIVDQLHARTLRRGDLAEVVEAAADTGELLQRGGDVLRRHAELPAHRGGSQGVQYIVAARQRQADADAGVFRQAQGEVHASALLLHLFGAHVGVSTKP